MRIKSTVFGRLRYGKLGLVNLFWDSPTRRLELHLFVHPRHWRWGQTIHIGSGCVSYGLGPLLQISM